MNKPLVSVYIISYNQERFIAEAIEGVVKQKTDFPFELLIGDDCSKDKTASIINDYKLKYPNIIVPVLRRRNIGPRLNGLDLRHRAKGKYIAICEGDDYWTDPSKLQQQVEVMEKYPKVSICHHRVRVIFDDRSKPDYISHPIKVKRWGSFGDVITRRVYIMTVSQMMRNGLINNYPQWYFDSYSGDYVLNALNADKGPVYFIDKVMAVYRINSGGIVSRGGVQISYKKKLAIAINRLMVLDNMDTYFSHRYHLYIDQCKKDRLKLIENILEIMPYSEKLKFVKMTRYGSMDKRYLRLIKLKAACYLFSHFFSRMRMRLS